jgi:hypothetical protein
MFLVNSDVLAVLAASLTVMAGPPGLIAHPQTGRDICSDTC